MSEQFLYHWVPKNMQGDILYPLNTLKETMPEVYSEHVKKYEGREMLLERKIPILNCLWNDVIHLTAVHPDKITEAFTLAGIERKSWMYYKIPAEIVVGPNAIAYLYKSEKSSIDEKMYEIFSLEHMDRYDVIPEKTIEYYKACKAEGKRPLVYHLIPHVLYKGNIDTTNFKKIMV